MFVYISCLIKVASFWSLEVASSQLLYDILVPSQLSKAINATSVSNHVTSVSYTSATYIKTNLVVHGLYSAQKLNAKSTQSKKHFCQYLKFSTKFIVYVCTFPNKFPELFSVLNNAESPTVHCIVHIILKNKSCSRFFF